MIFKARFQKFCLCLFSLVLLAKANNCLDKNFESRYLPKRIGAPGNTIAAQYLFKCDTMEVKAGDTTRIYSNLKFYFGSESNEKKTLLIKGALIVEGLPKYPVKFSGSLSESTLGIKLGNHPWGGFRVTESGSLILHHVVLHNAAIAIDSRSKKVFLENVWTEGCQNLIKPDKEKVKLDYSGMSIPSLNFENEGIISDKQPVASAEKSSESKISKPLLWGGTGLAAIGLAGVAIWYFSGSGDKVTTNPPQNNSAFPGEITFPTGSPRSP